MLFPSFVLNDTGPVHTYARYGSGLIIYNGMDMDYLGSSAVPATTTGPYNLAKVWLQELQVPFNPTPITALTCGATVVGINISPATAVNNLSAGDYQHTVTATLKDQLNSPQPNVHVDFTVISGPNSGVSGFRTVNASCATEKNGQFYSRRWRMAMRRPWPSCGGPDKT